MHLLTLTRLVQEAPAAASQTAQDAAGNSAPYDSIWAADGSSAASSAFEQVMLSNDKLFVVLGVVLIIWIGLVILLIRNDRRLASLEREVEKNIPQEDPLGPPTGTDPGPTEPSADRTHP